MEEKSKTMEVLGLKKSLRHEQQQQSQGVLGDEGMVSWGFGDKGGSLCDGFVDELLNLGDFGDNEDVEEAPKVAPLHAEETGHSNSPSSVLSEVSQFAGISLPAHDEADLEWVSYIIDDTISEFPTSSGVVVAQPGTKTASLPAKPVDLATTTVKNRAFSGSAEVPVRAKRSKRGRTATSWSKSSSTTTSSASSSSASNCLIYDHQSPLLYDPLPSKKQKKRGRKPKDKNAPSGASAGAGERRCSHCGVLKTPQWRAGPLGPKTLCNACGVRYKSGRLLPEYRPACSPQFQSSVHSNSHRKVLEMRRKREAELGEAATVAFY